MKSIQTYLTQKQTEFSQHAFFGRLERQASLGEVLPFAKMMSFWIMSFQDILRLNEQRVSDPRLKKIAAGHKAEDAGHELWFLRDLLHLEGELPDVGYLFGRETDEVREAAFALVSEVFRDQEDIERIALVMALESTGHVFFERIATYLENARFPLYSQLRYFSRKHLDVELDHDLFEEENEQFLDNLELSEAQEQACKQMVDRAYVAFNGMFDQLEEAARRNQSRPHVAPLQLAA